MQAQAQVQQYGGGAGGGSSNSAHQSDDNSSGTAASPAGLSGLPLFPLAALKALASAGVSAIPVSDSGGGGDGSGEGEMQANTRSTANTKANANVVQMLTGLVLPVLKPMRGGEKGGVQKIMRMAQTEAVRNKKINCSVRCSQFVSAVCKYCLLWVLVVVLIAFVAVLIPLHYSFVFFLLKDDALLVQLQDSYSIVSYSTCLTDHAARLHRTLEGAHANAKKKGDVAHLAGLLPQLRMLAGDI